MAVQKPLRVGIWCAYHITLEPSEGIGVFAHNLARGLASHPRCDKVVMVCRPKDEAVMAPTLQAGQGKIAVAAVPRHKWQSRLAAKLNWRTNRIFAKLGAWTEKRLVRARRSRIEIAQEYEAIALKKRWISVLYQSKTLRSLAVQICRSRYQLALPLLGILLRSTRRICHITLERTHRAQSAVNRAIERVIDACDVWIIPYVGLDRTFSKPTVVTIHDLVCFHFPEMVSPEWLAEFKRLAIKVAEQSTVSACMSNFIADNDLRGVLKLPDEKIRVVEPAAPADFGSLAEKSNFVDQYPVLEQPYIFYPAAFRPYKNHAALVEALAIEAAQGNRELQLVFTGIHTLPEDLRQLIDQRGLSKRVHVLGKVEREALSLFYHHAVATIVPSLYEQGSFPLMEAMFWSCPIACSRIQSLTDLFAPMRDSMIYFDPHDHLELSRVIKKLVRDREEIVRAQQQYRQQIFGRTWADAAQDWLDVLEYAVEAEGHPATTDYVEKTAA